MLQFFCENQHPSYASCLVLNPDVKDRHRLQRPPETYGQPLVFLAIMHLSKQARHSSRQALLLLCLASELRDLFLVARQKDLECDCLLLSTPFQGPKFSFSDR